MFRVKAKVDDYLIHEVAHNTMKEAVKDAERLFNNDKWGCTWVAVVDDEQMTLWANGVTFTDVIEDTPEEVANNESLLRAFEKMADGYDEVVFACGTCGVDWNCHGDCRLEAFEKDNELVLTYDADNGVSMADGLAMEFVTKAIGEHTVSNEVVILAARVAIAEGIRTNIKIKYDGVFINVDKKGELSEYPKGFCANHLDYLMRLLQT